MKKRNYWLDLFTGTTWDEFKAAGANITGFRKSRWKTLQRIQRGDYFLYLQEQLRLLRGELFGRRSEKHPGPHPDQTLLFA